MSKTQIAINPNIFNVNRTYTTGGSFFLQEKRGLVDTIHGRHEELDQLYKLLKLQDWDEDEFDFIRCAPEFASADPDEYKAMISTIAWQWEADSEVTNHLVPLLAPFVTNSTLWDTYLQINANEAVHARTYSEIVKLSFENPEEVMNTILADMDALRRLKAVSEALAKVQEVGLKLMRGEIDRTSDEARDAAMLAVCTIYIMETMQFGPSFQVAFAYGNVGKYTPIAEAIKKICSDEFTIHARVGEVVLMHEMALPEGKASFLRIRDEVTKIFCEVQANEEAWIEKIFANEAFQIPFASKQGFHDWRRFCERRVLKHLPLDVFADNGPIEIMEFIPQWVNINGTQISPQEARGSAYLLGGFVNDLPDGEKLDLAMV